MDKQHPAPNILFFMLDQLSAKWLEAAIDGVCPMPNVQRLCRNGVRFDNTFSNNPVCMPARSTLATGLTTRQHGVLQNGYFLDPAIPSMGVLLKSAGYSTAALGKVHLRPHFEGVHPDYTQYGFDECHITEDGRAGEWIDWIMQEHPQHLQAALATIWASSIPELEAYGPEKINLKEMIAKARESMDWTSPLVPNGDWKHYALPFPEEVSQTAWTTGHALRFLESVQGPFYAHVSYVQPHSPFCAPAEYFSRVDTSRIPEPLPATWQDDPNRAPALSKGFMAGQQLPDNWREHRHCYFADLAYLDDQLGLVLDLLERRNLIENTYIFFIADHGEMLFDHGFVGKENKHYDACIRVPLIISGPGTQRNTCVDQPVDFTDILPTVLDLCGVEHPAPRQMGPYLQQTPEALPGRSLLPLLSGRPADHWRKAAYVESYNTILDINPSSWARTIRTPEYRYTYYAAGGGEQLFNISEDSDELHNLAADARYDSVKRELKDMLLDTVVMQDYPHTPRQLFAHGVH